MANGNSNQLGLPIPIFTGEKYDAWSKKMKTYFLSQNLWDIVDKGIPIPEITPLTKQQDKQQQKQQQKDAASLFILHQAVDDYIFSKISGAETAKKAWDTLEKQFQGKPQSTALSDQDRYIAKESKKYLPLYKAILDGNLESVQDIYRDNKIPLEARITVHLDTALHVAVGTGKADRVVEYLLDEMSKHQNLSQLLALKNSEGNTALSIAAIVGNVPAADMILNKDQFYSLIEVPNNSNRIPLIEAARHGQKKMIQYLLDFGGNYLKCAASTSFMNDSGVSFVNSLINAGFYGLALNLLHQHGNLATKHLSTGGSLLTTIAGKPSAFRSGQQKKRKFIQFYKADKRKPSAIPSAVPSGEQKKPKLYERFKIVSYMMEKRETESKHHQALQLVKHLCKEITKNPDNYEISSSILKQPFLLAAELGVSEVVEEIINSFPDAIWFTNEKNHNIFHLAVMQRQEKVFQLISHMSGRRHLLLMSQDVDKNNILHLAGKLAPKNQLNSIPSAALQMQRELQWYKEVEILVPPDFREEKNYKGETPRMVFSEQHKELIKDGEKWMKDAATSCSVAAALIATVVFAAAITVPGDYNDDGQPTFHKLVSFTVFSISDAFSLFSSIAAIIMFLSVLTARYAEYDFHHSLPNRLILGLVMLFLSLSSLMVAFCSTVYLVLCDKKAYWILALVFAAASLPLSLFASSQYPLLCDLIISTYGPKISRSLRRFRRDISRKLRAWYLEKISRNLKKWYQKSKKIMSGWFRFFDVCCSCLCYSCCTEVSTCEDNV